MNKKFIYKKQKQIEKTYCYFCNFFSAFPFERGSAPASGPGTVNTPYTIEGKVTTTGAVTFGLQFKSSDGISDVDVRIGSMGLVMNVN